MAAQYGSVTMFLNTGRTLTKDVYFDDTANNPVRWDGGNGSTATSPTDFSVGLIGGAITDVVLAAASAQTKTAIAINGQNTGDILRNAIQLASVVTRTPLRIPFKAGDKITMVQLA